MKGYINYKLTLQNFFLPTEGKVFPSLVGIQQNIVQNPKYHTIIICSLHFENKILTITLTP